MKNLKHENFESEWINYHEAMKKKKEDSKMEVVLHGKLDESYTKNLKTVNYLSRILLGKFVKKRDWVLEFWIDKEKKKKAEPISCGVALVRPRKSTLYIRKKGSSLVGAIKKSLTSLREMMKRESGRMNLREY